MCLQYATYSCQYQSGPYSGSLDVCSFTDTNGVYSSSASFNTATGEYVFSTDDKDTFPPGTYELVITFTLGTVVESATFPFILADPCLGNSIQFTTTHPFTSGNVYQYVLGDTATQITYDNNALVTSDASVNCGTPTIEFLDSNG